MEESFRLKYLLKYFALYILQTWTAPCKLGFLSTGILGQFFD